MSSVDEFRTRGRKTITLPSGLTVVIRPSFQWDLLTEFGLVVPQPAPPDTADVQQPAVPSAESLDHLRALYDKAIVSACLDPPFQGRGALEHPEFVSLEDLAHDDYVALGQAILQHSGLTQEVSTTLDQFRENAVGPTGESDVSPLSMSPPPDPSDDTSRVLSEPTPYDVAGRGDGSSLTALVYSTTTTSTR